MTIFIITRGTPTKQDPQWGCFEYDQAKALAKTGHKVVVLSVDRRFRPFQQKIGISSQTKDNVTTYNAFVLPNVIVRKIAGEKILYRLRVWLLKKLYQRAVAENGQPDVLYSHYVFITKEAVALRETYHVPLVAMEHWSEIQKPNIPARILRMTDSYKNADQVVAVSKSLQKTLKEKFNVNACVVYNMVGKDFHYKPGTSSGPVQYVAAGSLIPRKGYDLLIQAFSKVHLAKEQWHLNIIGSGKEKENLQQLVEQYNLQDNITLSGQRSKEEIVALYQQSDVFVLPSRMETFGVVYIEAMACGLPVIATPCGGPEEFVNKDNGLLVPVNDVDQLAEAIEYMSRHYQEYDKQAIADYCQARFSSEVIAKQLTDIFEDVVAKYHTKTIN